jgi:hypothetical protein
MTSDDPAIPTGGVMVVSGASIVPGPNGLPMICLQMGHVEAEEFDSIMTGGLDGIEAVARLKQCDTITTRSYMASQSAIELAHSLLLVAEHARTHHTEG